ncbi:MAG: hypothetical protein JRF72_03835, partial [Deltaproteobacteria bacterium]|nr:hypothetical protein [Deltaproteobacteria bacterium]
MQIPYGNNPARTSIRRLIGQAVPVNRIGAAGENKVLYSAIVGDRGHLAAHNGLGAVMASKNLKAVVAYNGERNF